MSVNTAGRLLSSVAPGRRLRAALAGAAAGCVLVALTLLFSLLTGIPAPPEVMQDAISEQLGGAFTSWVIERLQFWSKPALLLGWAAAQVGALVALGLIAVEVVRGRSGRWRTGRPYAAGAAIGVAYWAATGLLVLPVLGIGLFGSGVRDGLAAMLLALPAHLLAGLALAFFWRALAGTPSTLSMQTEGRDQPDAADRPGRRRLLAGVAATGAAAVAGVAFWRFVSGIEERATAPAAARPDAPLATVPPGLRTADGPLPFIAPPGLSEEITPTERFYVISKNLRDPVVRAEDWALEVTGLVRNPLLLTLPEVLALPAREQLSTLMCISNPVGGDLISTARWKGVPLAEVLDMAGVRDGAGWLLFTSEDGYTESIPLAVARAPSSLLVYEMNGAPLTDKHGFPLRVLLTGRYGMKNPKWLKKIEVVPRQIDGYWEKRYWDAEAIINTMSRFDTRPRTVPGGADLLLGGIAFAGDRGVRGVEVSVDDGATWQPAAVKPALSPYAWSLWSFGWRTGDPGKGRLLVRATDGGGTLQDAVETDPHPAGATGLHGLDVTVR